MSYSNLLDEYNKDPAFKAHIDAIHRRDRRARRVIGWTLHIPLVGQLVYVFWYAIFTEGLRSTVKPRWGALTFSFLNDGERPSLWHTIYSVTHDNQAPYSGIYPGRAPRTSIEAEWVARNYESLPRERVDR